MTGRTFAILVVVVTSLAFGACTITETGNPGVVAAQMGLTAYSSDPAIASIGDGNADLVIDQAWVSVRDVRFVPAERCESPEDAPVSAPGPFVADLTAGPSRVAFEVAPGEFCRVRVPLAAAASPVPTGAPPELAVRSLVVIGRREGETPLRIVSELAVELDVRSGEAPFVLDDTRRAVLLSFDVAAWFRDLRLDDAERDEDGTISVDRDSNADLLTAFEANVSRGTALFRDGDGDGELDEDDRGDELAHGESD